MENTSSKRLVDELIEDKEFNQKILKTLKSKNVLSPSIFDGSLKMHDNIRKRLLEISDLFVDYVGIDFFIHDIILTGSLANYNWSKFSDVDLHILIDMSEFTPNNSQTDSSFNLIIKEFFMAKKSLWNNSHDIKIKGFDVEIYVEDIDEEHISSGVYSILDNKWVIKPQKKKEMIDERTILEKGDEYANLIDSLPEKAENGINIVDQINDISDKLKKFRKTGLESGGEYSYENLTFKLLRRNGYIEKLHNLKKKYLDKNLSIPR